VKTDLQRYTIEKAVDGFVYNEQQRITSVGRFVTGKFAIRQDGKEQTLSTVHRAPSNRQRTLLRPTRTASLYRDAPIEGRNRRRQGLPDSHRRGPAL
jgi:hypothetical protein